MWLRSGAPQETSLEWGAEQLAPSELRADLLGQGPRGHGHVVVVPDSVVAAVAVGVAVVVVVVVVVVVGVDGVVGVVVGVAVVVGGVVVVGVVVVVAVWCCWYWLV